MGTGFVVVIDPDDRVDFLNIMKNRMPVKEIGHVENGSGVSIPKYDVEFSGYY